MWKLELLKIVTKIEEVYKVFLKLVRMKVSLMLCDFRFTGDSIRINQLQG